jgi:hypothetical protein
MGGQRAGMGLDDGARDGEAQAAVLAGQLRRAYLKGSAHAKGCKV